MYVDYVVCVICNVHNGCEWVTLGAEEVCPDPVKRPPLELTPFFSFVKSPAKRPEGVNLGGYGTCIRFVMLSLFR